MNKYTNNIVKKLSGSSKKQKSKHYDKIKKALQRMDLPTDEANILKVQEWIDIEDNEFGAIFHSINDIEEIIDARGDYLPNEGDEFAGSKGKSILDAWSNKIKVGDAVQVKKYPNPARKGVIVKILDRENARIQFEDGTTEDMWVNFDVTKLDKNGNPLGGWDYEKPSKTKKNK